MTELTPEKLTDEEMAALMTNGFSYRMQIARDYRATRASLIEARAEIVRLNADLTALHSKSLTEMAKKLGDLLAWPCEGNCGRDLKHVDANHHDQGDGSGTWFCQACWDAVITGLKAEGSVVREERDQARAAVEGLRAERHLLLKPAFDADMKLMRERDQAREVAEIERKARQEEAETARQALELVNTLTLECEAWANRRDALRTALRLVLARCRDPNAPAGESYERVAEEFWRDTGLMAPGKSVPLAMGSQNPDEVRARFDEWEKAKWAEAWAAARKVCP